MMKQQNLLERMMEKKKARDLVREYQSLVLTAKGEFEKVPVHVSLFCIDIWRNQWYVIVSLNGIERVRTFRYSRRHKAQAYFEMIVAQYNLTMVEPFSWPVRRPE